MHTKINAFIQCINDILHPTAKLERRRFPAIDEIVKQINRKEIIISNKGLDISTIEELDVVLGKSISTIRQTKVDRVSKLRELQGQIERTMKMWPREPRSYPFLVTVGVMSLFGFNVTEFQFEYYLQEKDFLMIKALLQKYLLDVKNLKDATEKQLCILQLVLTCPQPEEALQFAIDNMPEHTS